MATVEDPDSLDIKDPDVATEMSVESSKVINWHSTTAEEVDGGPRVAAVAEFHGCEEFLGFMWVLSEICSGLCYGGYTAD